MRDETGRDPDRHQIVLTDLQNHRKRRLEKIDISNRYIYDSIL